MGNVSRVKPQSQDNVGELQRPTPVQDELNPIKSLLSATCSKGAFICLNYNGKLRVHIDVAQRKDVILTEGMLPLVGAGLFNGTVRAAIPNCPSCHRVSAFVGG